MAGTTVKELSMMVHTHPTLCEVLDEAFKGAVGMSDSSREGAQLYVYFGGVYVYEAQSMNITLNKRNKLMK